MSVIQAVHLRYGYKTGDTGQPIPVIDRTVGGEGLKVYFSEDLEDPAGHHSNAGGISIINGPGDPSGYDVWGTVSFWIEDLWGPDPDSRTECQAWMSLCEVLSGGASGDTVATFPAHEFYAPLQHDALLWDELGHVSSAVDGHDPSVKHIKIPVGPLHVPANRRLRAHLGQFHGNLNVPGYDLPYPGRVRRAWADLCAVPR